MIYVSYYHFYLNTLITNDYYFIIFVITCIPIHLFIFKILKFKINDSSFISYIYTIFLVFYVFYPITNYYSRNDEIQTFRVPLLNYYYHKGSHDITFRFKNTPFTRAYKKIDIDTISNYEVVLNLREAFKDFYTIESIYLNKK